MQGRSSCLGRSTHGLDGHKLVQLFLWGDDGNISDDAIKRLLNFGRTNPPANPCQQHVAIAPRDARHDFRRPSRR